MLSDVLSTCLQDSLMRERLLWIVRRLIQLGAEIDHVDDYGATPLCLAASKESWAITDLLIEYGANTDHQWNGQFPVAAV